VTTGAQPNSFADAINDERVLDDVRGVVVDLEVGLIRMQHGRHHLSEMFATQQEALHG